jgi:hypothetical protein
MKAITSPKRLRPTFGKPGTGKFVSMEKTDLPRAQSPAKFQGKCNPKVKPAGCTAVNILFCDDCFLAKAFPRQDNSLTAEEDERQHTKRLRSKRIQSLNGCMRADSFANPKYRQWLVDKGYDPADVDEIWEFYRKNSKVFRETLRATNQQLGIK